MDKASASLRQAWCTAGVLCFANAVSYLDRQVLVLLIEPIKHDLQIGDAAFGLLQGFSFALLYALLGIPIAAIADRRSRIALIRAGCFVWSFATMLCGFASSFGALFAARIGVGAGEAALNPAATSLLADRFPGPERSLAMSVFVLGASLGAGLALVVGGQLIGALPHLVELPVIGRVANWQLAFISCGAIGLLTIVLLATVAEPPRSTIRDDVRVSTSGGRQPIYEVAAIIVGFSLIGMMSFGVGSWLPAMIMRRFALGATEVGTTYGLLVMVTAPLGIMSGGWLGSELARRWGSNGPLFAAIGGGVLLTIASALPAVALSYAATLGVAALFNFAAPLPFGLAYACLTDRVLATHRARLVAIYGLALNLIGYGLGPLSIGLMTDHLFGEQGLASAMLTLASVAGVGGLIVLTLAIRFGRAKPAPLTGGL